MKKLKPTNGNTSKTGKFLKRPKIRYQHQPWYMKVLLRLRHDPIIPFRAIRIWISLKLNKDKTEDGPSCFRFAWGLSRGLASVEKSHLYSAEEVFGRVRSKVAKVALERRLENEKQNNN